MRKSYLSIITFALLLTTLLSLWLFPSATPALGTASLLFSLAISIHAIFEKHKGTENARAKILKEAGVLIITLVLIIFLGGIAAMLANLYVSPSFGAVVGLVSAVAVSFMVGYLIRKGASRLGG